jgi:Xaa-Pro dipeptidase
VKLVDVSKELKYLRLIKRSDEIAAIKKACRLSLKILNETEMEGKSEKEVVYFIECEMRKRDALPSFPTIVAFGKNTASPHHIPENKKFVTPALVDMGARYNGYCADITRTFVEKRGKKLYEIVESALYLAIDEMREGVKAKEVYKKVEKFFAKHGYKMRHALGHSIGINVHDGYSINENADFVLKENMVFAVEPAVYLKNYGIRIEEDVVIRKNRAEIIR